MSIEPQRPLVHSRRSRFRFRSFGHMGMVIALTTACAGGGCRPEEVLNVDRPSTKVVLNIPGSGFHELAASPDGGLFVAHAGGVDRLIPSRSSEWRRIAEPEFVPIAFYASSRDTVFALSQMSGEVHRWTAAGGFRTMRTPLSDSIAQSGHMTTPIPLVGIWGRGSNDVYAVGNYGAVMHFDGRVWTLQPNPLVQHAFQSYAAALWSVGGDRHRVYAAGTFDLIGTTGREWALVVPPIGEVPHGWKVTAALGEGIFVAGRKRDTPGLQAFHHADDEWVSLSESLRSVRGDIADGAAQADGSVLLWTHHVELIHVRPDYSVRVYTRLPLQTIIGAAVVADRLYVGGTRRGNAVVLQIL